jgi:pyridoxal 5'-phosphate synthase pdxT subunit
VLVGVLALQGASAAHLRAVERLGAKAVPVKTADDLADVERLIIPGGESTTISFLLESNELFDPIAERLADGMAAFGTCAGMILLGSEIIGGRADQRCFGAIDIAVARNAFGRQVDSFETTLVAPAVSDEPLPAVFIRAPNVARVGPEVEVLAKVDGRPVLCRQGSILTAAFHPELSDDGQLHDYFLQL